MLHGAVLHQRYSEAVDIGMSDCWQACGEGWKNGGFAHSSFPEESQGDHEPQATQDVLYLLSQL